MAGGFQSAMAGIGHSLLGGSKSAISGTAPSPASIDLGLGGGLKEQVDEEVKKKKKMAAATGVEQPLGSQSVYSLLGVQA
jgi:hypothetical protein